MFTASYSALRLLPSDGEDGTVWLGWGVAQQPAHLGLKPDTYTHHRENQQQRGKIHTVNKYLQLSPTFVYLKNRVTLHTSILGLFSIKVILLLCCFKPIKKGSETLIYCICCICYFTLNNGLVRESHYRKQQLSQNGRGSPGGSRAPVCSLVCGAGRAVLLGRAAQRRTAHQHGQPVVHLAYLGQPGACKASSASRNSGNIINRADQFWGTHTL